MKDATHIIVTTLERSHQLLQGGQVEMAECLVQNLLAQFPNEVNSLHLLGLIQKAKRQLPEAVITLKKALTLGGDKDAIGNNLGNVYYDLGDYRKALDIFEDVLSRHATHVDALYNGALSALALNKVETALRYSRLGTAKYGTDKFKYLEAQAHEKFDDMDAAAACYKNILDTSPNYFQALYAFAVLLRKRGQFQQAKLHLERATKVQPRSVEAWFVLANIYYQLGDDQAADIAFRRLLTLDPTHVEAHQYMNNMYFEFGHDDKFGKSFQIGIASNPKSVPLHIAQIDTLLNAEMYEECASALDEAQKKLGNLAILKARRGMLSAKVGDVSKAISDLRAAHSLAPDDAQIMITLARYLICAGEETDALVMLDRAESLLPFDQNLWALRGTAWTILGDHKKADWLFGYNDFVQIREISLSGQSTDKDSFLSNLHEQLDKLHRSKNAPLNQTLKNGTQTIGQLLDQPVPIIQVFKGALAHTIKSYLKTLPQDNDHPFLKRNAGKFRFSASWSVKLTKAGFHVSHVHPVGWVSSAFYVAFDKTTISDHEDDAAGWLHFGVPGLSLAKNIDISPARLIKPEPGLLALFPSYCWHGTNPIIGDGTRLTAPFDITPI